MHSIEGQNWVLFNIFYLLSSGADRILSNKNYNTNKFHFISITLEYCSTN